jgi:membrane protease YdiL (CAAX protease family)
MEPLVSVRQLVSAQESESEVAELLHIIRDTWRHVLTKPGIIIISSFLGIVVWGPKGDPIFSAWLLPRLEDLGFSPGLLRQLVSYGAGLFLLVLVPVLLIRFRFKEPLGQYGLGLGNVRLGLAFTATLIAVCVVPFALATGDRNMWKEYPLLYQGLTVEQIRAQFSWASFMMYELIYGCFFFIIEFIFRGYLLFGLRERFGQYAVLIQMLSYTAWHLPKPVTELLGTPMWGFAVAAVTLRLNSLWYVFFAHWLLNVFMDTLILVRQGVV